MPQRGRVVAAKGLFLDPPGKCPQKEVAPQALGWRSTEFRGPGGLQLPQWQAGQPVNFGGNSLRQEIGLGQAKASKRIEIFWPVTGKTQTLTGLALDCFYKIREGDSQAVPWALKSFAFPPMAGHHHVHGSLNTRRK